MPPRQDNGREKEASLLNDANDPDNEGDDPDELDCNDEEHCNGNGYAGLRRLLRVTRRRCVALNRDCFRWQRRRETPLSLESPLLVLAYCQRRRRLSADASYSEDPREEGTLRLPAVRT